MSKGSSYISPQHVCFDIETMSTRPNAAIAQIGAYWLDGIEEFPQPERSFKVNVDISDCQRLGLTVDGDTIYWWLRQTEHVRRGLDYPTPLPVEAALSRFNSWLDLIAPASELEMWSHATFDAVILQEAYRVAGIQPHVPHRQMSDLRTLRYFPEHERIDLKRGAVNEHDAGFDAWAEGQEVVRALRAAGTLD